VESKHRFQTSENKEAVIAYVAKYASKGETASSSYEDGNDLDNTDDSSSSVALIDHHT
jgi:hypothetical protein